LAERSGDRQLLLDARADGETVVLSIRDNGQGILPQHLRRVVEPMFTTRSARGQRGLGLTIAHAIVRDHGGQLDVLSRFGEGVTAIVRVPVAGAPALADRRLTPRSNEAVSAITEALAPPKMPRTSPITLPPPPR